MKNIILTLLYLSVLLYFVGYHPLVYPKTRIVHLEDPMEFHTKALDTLKLTLDLGSQDPSMPELQTAMKVLFEDHEDLESPLSNAHSLVEGDDRASWERAKAILLTHLDRPETTLVLLEGKDDGRGYQPERGENTEANWVFSLVIPSLSDHIYWIVLPKEIRGQTPYVYGFN